MSDRPGQLEVRDRANSTLGYATVLKVPGASVVNGVAELGAVGSYTVDDLPDAGSTSEILAYLTTGRRRGLVYTNGHEWILIQRQLNVKDFGAIGDGTSHLISEDDISAHLEWIGYYEVGDEWDYVGINECHLCAFAGASLPWVEYLAANPGADPGDNIVWNGSAEPGIYSNAGVYYPEGKYLVNKTVVARGVSGFEIRGASKRGAAVFLITDDKPLFLYRCLSYGSIHSLSCYFAGSHNYGHALMEVDWTGVFSSLRPQQLFMPNLHFQGTKEADYGLRFAKTGGGSQGDTIDR